MSAYTFLQASRRPYENAVGREDPNNGCCLLAQNLALDLVVSNPIDKLRFSKDTSKVYRRITTLPSSVQAYTRQRTVFAIRHGLRQ